MQKESDQHLNAYRPWGGNYGKHGRGYQGPQPSGQGPNPKSARDMSNVQDLFWCDSRDKKGGLIHAPNCDMHDCFVVQRKKQETNTAGKAEMPNHYGCTVTCPFGGRRKHYEDECYHKQRLSPKLRNENSQKGGQNGKGNKDKGRGKSKGRGKDEEKGKGGPGGPDKKNEKNQDKSGGNPNPTPGGTSPEPSGG